jgi:hypothetical protein
MAAGDVHVMPRDDLIEHATSGDCTCGPRTEPVEREDGSMGWLLVHHSLDGRERNEVA